MASTDPAPGPAPFAKPPRLTSLDDPGTLERVDDDIEPVDGWVELNDVELDGQMLAFPDVEMVEFTNVSLRSCRLILPNHVEVRARRSMFSNCDISQVQFKTVQTCRFELCKMTGTAFVGALSDTEFTECRFQLGSLAMSSIDRVAFETCEFNDVDFLESKLSNVTFAGSSLVGVSLHRSLFDRVDLRGARPIELRNVSSLQGCLVDDEQIFAMAPLLAAIVGLSNASDLPDGTQ